MTARDFELQCAGYLWREERAMEKIAVLAAAVMSQFAEKPVTVRALLDRSFGQTKVPGYRAWR